MLLTDRNFNTNFYDPALRHSSVQIFNYMINILNGLFYHSALAETTPGLFAGADSNELLFLGAMNSMTTGIVLRKIAFPKSISNTRPAKAKVHFKMGSTYEALVTPKKALQRIDRKNLHDIKEKGYYCWGSSGRILVITPEQNQSWVRSPPTIVVGDNMNMHSGNFGKYSSSCWAYASKREELSVEFLLNKNSVTIPISLEFTTLVGTRLDGGKIVEKAKALGNARDRLNSIRLNNANQ